MITNFVKDADYIGVIDIDIFRIDGEYYISEVNPRFGGGYLHGYECGVNFPRLLITNLQGKQNQLSIGAYSSDTVMMKYNEVSIRK